MTPADQAPVYVAAYDLARAVLQATDRLPRHRRFVLGRRIEEAALDVVDAVYLALVDPTQRPQRLGQADHALARLRTGLRLAQDLDALGERPAVALGQQLAEVGRQLGGWQRSLARAPRAP